VQHSDLREDAGVVSVSSVRQVMVGYAHRREKACSEHGGWKKGRV
jgi:hypothetical protein